MAVSDEEFASKFRPGQPVKGSKSGEPIMALLDLMGRRWSMGILWNLASQPRTFRDLQSSCDSASPTVLNTRLKELRAVGLVERTPNGYGLTANGRELFEKLEPLGGWAAKWVKTL